MSDLLTITLIATNTPLAHRDDGGFYGRTEPVEMACGRPAVLTFNGARAPGVFL